MYRQVTNYRKKKPLINKRRNIMTAARGVTVGARKAGASVTNTVQLAGVSNGKVTSVTSTRRSMGKTNQ